MNEFDQFSYQHLDKMKEGIKFFNAQKYWECHEELEHHWLEEPGPIRNIYWAIIQVAASLIHYREGNLIGAVGLINKAKKKFERCEQNYLENNLLRDKLSWSELKNLVNEIPDKPELHHFEKLFIFKFKDEHC